MNLKFNEKFLTVLAVCGSSIAFAQVTTSDVHGKVTDRDNYPVSGALVNIVHVPTGNVYNVETNNNGNFSSKDLPAGGPYTISVADARYPEKTISNVFLKAGEDRSLDIKLTESVDLEEIVVVGSGVIDLVKERQTPVAATTITGAVIQEKIGNLEFPEILSKTPSVYATKGSGGFGDSRINVRGFDQRNTAVIINGQPVNDMENGKVYWSNWAGLADVASVLQIQRGLGASKLAVPSVGGTITVLTKSADKKKGGVLKVMGGNNGYSKVIAGYNTGLNQNGWSASFLLGRTQGDGYVTGLKFEGYTYLASVGYKPSEEHAFNFNLTGAAQWHNQRSTSISIRDYFKFGGDDFRRFNADWGFKNGEGYTLRENFYNKPIASLNWDWKINNNLDLSTVIYGSWGRGGGTGDRGRNFGVNPYKKDLTQAIADGNLPYRDAQTGEILFDKIVQNNRAGTPFAVAKNPYTGLILGSHGYKENGVNSNIVIKRSSMNSHNWYGAISNLKYEIGNWTLGAGVDLRAYKGYHYRVVNDLLGLDGYYSTGNKNLNTGVIVEETYKPRPFADTGLGGQKIDYYNVGDVKWSGLNIISEYKASDISGVFQAGLSNQSYKRTDYFDQPHNYESDTKNMLGGFVKGGVNYNINRQNNVFVNAGYIERQPNIDAVFPNYANKINDEVKNEKITSFELGYGLKTYLVDLSLNLYSTTWSDRYLSKSITISKGVEGSANFEGIQQKHRGIEVEAKAKPTNWLNVIGMLSIGDWKYSKDIQATVFDDSRNKIGDVTLYLKDAKVGDAAQTTASLGIEVKPIHNFVFDASWTYANNLYADFDIAKDENYLKPNNEGALKLPSYSLMDAGVSYKFDLGAQQSLGIRLNVNNVLDTEYISEASSNIYATPTSKTYKGIDERNFVWFGYGRTWNIGVTYKF